MANFLGNLGAAFRGQQEYETFLDQREQAKLKIESDKLNLDELKANRARQKDVNQGLFDFLSGDQGIQGIGAPPVGQSPQDQPPPVQAPQPGQQSVPMQQPVPYSQRPIPGGPPGPPQGPPQGQQGMPPQRPQQGMGPPPQGMPPGGPQMRPGPPPGPPQVPQQGQPPGPPPVPPYQTVGGGGPPPQMQMGLPPPPAQPENAPPPNSMSIKDAAKFIKQKGIKDPTTAVQILEKLTPYLNNEAKQEAQYYKLQLDQANKVNVLNEKIRNDDLLSEDRKATVEERRAAHESAIQNRLLLGQLTASIQQQRVNNQTQSLKEKASSNSLNQDDLRFMAEQYWAGDKSVLQGLGRSPQALSAARHAIVQYGKEQGKTGSDVAQATAEFEGLKAGERALGTRTANVGLAVNEANNLSDLALKTSNEWSRSGIASLNELQALATKKGSSPELRRFVAANNSFINAYARAISPTGAPAQKEKDHARDILNEGFSKGDYAATIDILKQEMEAAKQAPQATKEELRKLAKAGNPNQQESTKTSSGSLVFSNASELQAAIKSGKIKKGDTFADPSGGLHTVN